MIVFILKKSAWEPLWKTNKQEEQINLFLLNYKVNYTKPMYSDLFQLSNNDCNFIYNDEYAMPVKNWLCFHCRHFECPECIIMQTRSYAVSWIIHVCIILIMCARTNASHFRGGTISWKPTGRENEVLDIYLSLVPIYTLKY